MTSPAAREASSPSLYPAIVEYIYAASDGGQRRFWWSSLGPIGLITDVDAADSIVSALRFPR